MIHNFWIIGLKYLKIPFPKSEFYSEFNEKNFLKIFIFKIGQFKFWNLFMEFLENFMPPENEKSFSNSFLI